MGYLAIEYFTSSYWEVLASYNKKTPADRSVLTEFAFRTIEFSRLIFLFIIYLMVFHYPGPMTQSPSGYASLSILTMAGWFLALNFLWNVILSPNHKLVRDRVIEIIKESLDSNERNMRSIVLVGVLWISQLVFYYGLFPAAGLVIIICALFPGIAPYTTFLGGYLPIAQSDKQAEWIIYMLLTQSVLKLVQLWALHLTQNSLESSKVRRA